MTRETHRMPSETLWDFALRIYAADGVADACLTIQDSWQADIPLLLYAGWMGTRGFQLTPAQMAQADDAIRDWREQVIRPLRTIRRRMKSGPHPAPSDDSEALRTRVKAAELQAEKLQLQLLERDLARLGMPDTPPDQAIAANVRVLVGLFAQSTPAAPDSPAVRAVIAAMVAGTRG